ncbi:hypothetical protein LWI28_026046 [Acer negundo]|uniref:Uncharacterized protein n=1 Tax=Acer negundo TaxID=4023 RepID=A0AAD5JR14_ACENE|nr:hypothetical protein LWI28_026046 [Acer negundo]
MMSFNIVLSRKSFAKVVKNSVDRYRHQDQFQEAFKRVEIQGSEQDKVHKNAKKKVETLNWDESRKMTFNVTMKEDPESIRYKMILNWLGLDRDVSNSETSSDTAVVKGDQRGGFNSVQEDKKLVVMPSSNQGELQKLSGEKAKSNNKGKYASDWRVEESDALVSGKAIMDCGGQLKNNCEGINEVNDEVALVVDKVKSVSHVSDYLNLRLHGEEVISQGRSVIRNKNGGKGLSTCKRHGMVTRKDRSKEVQVSSVSDFSGKRKGLALDRWDLKVKVANVIENGIELGLRIGTIAGQCGERSQTSEKTQRTVNWRLSEEIAKVIEVGIALGFDFNGKVDFVSKEIRRRVEEDELRFEG